jgi:flagellin
MTVNNIARNQMSESMMRVASGNRINSAADDAAGLAIVEGMEAQIRGLDQGTRNTMDMQALVNTAEGGLDTVSDSLNRIRELSVQAANGTLSPTNREAIQMEITSLTDGIQAAVEGVQFNGMNLLDGSVQNFNTASAPDGTGAQVSINDMSDIAQAMTAIAQNGSFDLNAIDAASAQVVGERAPLGALSNRMDYTASTNTVSSLNLIDARSRIADADIANEMRAVETERVMNEIQILMQRNVQDREEDNSRRALGVGM